MPYARIFAGIAATKHFVPELAYIWLLIGSESKVLHSNLI